jgi:hypothetical protein
MAQTVNTCNWQAWAVKASKRKREQEDLLATTTTDDRIMTHMQLPALSSDQEADGMHSQLQALFSARKCQPESFPISEDAMVPPPPLLQRSETGSGQSC